MSERKGTKALELWCKRLVKDCPNVQIDNMTTSWRNGVAFCALVHHFRPDLIDLSKLKPENIYENNQLAFSIAEKDLGIPALLDPEDMVENEVPDRLSILTYLSQFYQRLGHTVNSKVSETEPKIATSSLASTQSTTPIKFGKTGLDKCTACSLPVYLAQRLMVANKLYHRRCFRCSKCSGHLNPKSFQLIEGSEFICDSCKNEKTISKFFNNNDQIGMLAFNDHNQSISKTNAVVENEDLISPKQRPRPRSIIERINMFEKNIDKDKNVEDKQTNVSLKEDINNKYKELTAPIGIITTSEKKTENIESILVESDTKQMSEDINLSIENESTLYKNMPEKVYKSNIQKFNFLQTQLSGDTLDIDNTINEIKNTHIKYDNESPLNISLENPSTDDKEINIPCDILREENNITDDTRIAKNHSTSSNLDSSPNLETSEVNKCEPETLIVPPRRKKLISPEKTQTNVNKSDVRKPDNKEYPDHLNPFSDDEDEKEEPKETPKKPSTNPFGSSDEEADDVTLDSLQRLPINQESKPIKRLLPAYNNPFWSDGEEPSSDEETQNERSKMNKSSMTTSTPNLPGSVPRRKKLRAPQPPVITVAEAPHHGPISTSTDDVASISSVNSYNSTIHSDQKSCRTTPRLTKKRIVPTPPDSLSTLSGAGSLDKGIDTSSIRTTPEASSSGRKVKGPAPGLPLPERREVKLQMTPEELQVQLDLLETQQLGLERQGVLIEQMIRDKCDEASASSVPQEEVEDLVIQLCELVNEKNDLFRKQTELMYIRRQQRLEQEQADIEHEIRVIQSRPTVNRIDADKAREEQLVCRLVEIVRLRDELVQQLDAERRRERQEDLAIAASIANKRAQRNSESNSSSMKSVEVLTTPKKNKVKDKVKKQLKKAKHTLIPKKKEDGAENKEEKNEKEKKSK